MLRIHSSKLRAQNAFKTLCQSADLSSLSACACSVWFFLNFKQQIMDLIMQSDQIDSVRSLCLCHCTSNVCPMHQPLCVSMEHTDNGTHGAQTTSACSALFVLQLHKHVHLSFLCILLLSSNVAEDQDLFDCPCTLSAPELSAHLITVKCCCL